jgi:hypothetical protein
MLERMARAERRFDAYGRPLTFRMSPLAGLSRDHRSSRSRRLAEFLGITRHALALDDALLEGVMDQIPMKDIGRFIGAARHGTPGARAMRPGCRRSSDPSSRKPACLSSSMTEAGFHRHLRSGPDLAGLFEVATMKPDAAKAYGRSAILSSLKWARIRGARHAWLQVEADNEVRHWTLPGSRLPGSIATTTANRQRRRLMGVPRLKRQAASCSSPPARWSTRMAGCSWPSGRKASQWPASGSSRAARWSRRNAGRYGDPRTCARNWASKPSRPAWRR